MPRGAEYKPLLFTTTMRSPERMGRFLGVLLAHDGETLTDALAEKVAGELIARGLYAPMKMPASAKDKIKRGARLSERETAKIMRDNPQLHKEAGFRRGWPSRFDTWFKFAKELGFVFYAPGEKIAFSGIGAKLAGDAHHEFHQQAFLNAFAKYQRHNPFRRARNQNAPLLLLLSVIERLNKDADFNRAGISMLELPLLLYWKDDDADQLYRRIKQLRRAHGYAPSWEVIVDICQNEIMQGEDIKRSAKSIMNDYPDEFVRKMRLTGLVSLRGGGRFVDINRNERKKARYVLNKYARHGRYETEREYFEYLSEVDGNLISLSAKAVSQAAHEKFLSKWSAAYSWQTIKAEMLVLARGRLSKDDVLKYLPNPVRLEFLTALAIKSRLPDVTVRPNYPVDDEGLPTSTAAGNRGDIECVERGDGVLVEVTLLQGAAQSRSEAWPIQRHLTDFQKRLPGAMCRFVAPGIHTDTVSQVGWLLDTKQLLVIPQTIHEFVRHLDAQSPLYQARENHSIDA